jgi:hypothetical protein
LLGFRESGTTKSDNQQKQHHFFHNTVLMVRV